ncbi:hypothetical protein PENSPDRAFT_670984 [Peniophora sp. CONT]|nr:hypothetical protein PENSPDRAFT_670984 [Peniophora sp. CONT]
MRVERGEIEKDYSTRRGAAKRSSGCVRATGLSSIIIFDDQSTNLTSAFHKKPSVGLALYSKGCLKWIYSSASENSLGSLSLVVSSQILVPRKGNSDGHASDVVLRGGPEVGERLTSTGAYPRVVLLVYDAPLARLRVYGTSREACSRLGGWLVVGWSNTSRGVRVYTQRSWPMRMVEKVLSIAKERA